MIDIHTHVLAGLDDGPATLEESVALAREAAANGVGTLVATPHVRDDYPTTLAARDAALAAVREALGEAEVAVEIRGGAEVAFDYLDRLDVDQLVALSLGGSETYILVEPPVFGWPLDALARVRRLHADGLTVVLAHPERNATVQASPARLVELLDAGTLVQLTAASLVGGFGPAAQRTAKALIAAGRAHVVATDTHVAGGRRASLALALDEIRGAALGQWLTVEVPAAILAGERIPPRPAEPRGLFAHRRRAR